MDLNELVVEMKLFAKANPFVILGTPPPVGQHRRVEQIDGLLDGKKMLFQLTLDVFPTNRAVWHMSFSVEGKPPITEDLATKVRQAFFGDQAYLEIPSVLWGPTCKQYVTRTF